MPRSASTGVYTAPSNSFNPAVTNTTIGSAAWNATQADYVTALAHTASTTRALYPITSQVQDGALLWGGTAGGTADALTITLTPAITAYAAGQTFRFVAASANATATPTLAVNGLAATVITRGDGSPLLAGDIAAGSVIEIVYNAAAFRLGSITASQAVGNDGATTTSSATSISLTSASNRVQAVTMTADAQSVFLPDARTLSVGGVRYIINNAGSRTFGVRSGNPNQFVPADFSAGTGWTAGTGWAIAAGVATKTAGVQSDLTQAITTAATTSYVVTFTVTSISAGTVQPVFSGGGADVVGTARSAPGTYTETITSNGNTAAGFRGNSTFAGSIDNVSVTLAVPSLLAVVPPGATAECSLTSAVTAEGLWVVTGRDLQPALVICDAALAATLTQTVEVVCKLTDTLSLHFAQNASGHPFVFAVDHSTYPAAVGTAVLIVASSLTVEHAFRISDAKAFFKIDGTTSNCFNVTVSGTTCTVSTAATAAVFDAATFTGAPLMCALGANNDLFVALDTSGTTVRAQAVDASGTNPSAGASVNVSALGTGSVNVGGIYRISASTALALYRDDSGVSGSPFSVRGVVLSVSGTTITVNTSAGINDVTATSVFSALPSVQLTSTTYIIAYYQGSGTLVRAVSVSVSGTTTTFGTPFTVETVAADQSFGAMNATRFQPNLFRLSDTTALHSYTDGVTSRHLILTNIGGTIAAGTILYNLFSSTGGNFPQSSNNFLGFSGLLSSGILGSRTALLRVSISGTSLSVATTNLPPNGGTFQERADRRFGLSGGICGISLTLPMPSSSSSAGAIVSRGVALYRRSSGLFLGYIALPGMAWGSESSAGSIAAAATPIEVAPSRAAFMSAGDVAQGTSTLPIKLAILEFIA